MPHTSPQGKILARNLFTTRGAQSSRADSDATPHAAITPITPPAETPSAGAAAFCVFVVDAPLPLAVDEPLLCDAPEPLAAEPDADAEPDGDTEGAGDARSKRVRLVLRVVREP